jgi:hypothetical protein
VRAFASVHGAAEKLLDGLGDARRFPLDRLAFLVWWAVM